MKQATAQCPIPHGLSMVPTVKHSKFKVINMHLETQVRSENHYKLVRYGGAYALIGAPMLCNLFCREMGRHVHISPCRSSSGMCSQPEVQHIDTRMAPATEIAKDWVSHRLFWARIGKEFAICIPEYCLYLTEIYVSHRLQG